MSLDHELPTEADRARPVLDRPNVLATPRERAVAWIEWIGIGRFVTAALSVAMVCGGVYWLTRNPPPPTEASLPVAAVTAPSGTLPVPVPAPAASSTVPPVERSAVVVHVVGGVYEPGVYLLVDGDRVGDAVAAAGGATVDADVDRLNLAAPLRDGDRVQVPLIGEEVEVADLVISAPSASSADSTGSTGSVMVDVNRADVDELEQLPGVGPATAVAIVTERDRGGPFASPADLERVPGIGPAKLAALEGYIVT